MMELTALLLSDGKPGHFHCSEGILAAARRQRPIDVATVRIARPAWAPTDLLAWMTNAKISPTFILSRVYGLDLAALPTGDVIVSAGGDTLAANIALARLTGRPNLFFGSLRQYRPQDFALALNSYTTEAPAPNQVKILKPSPADPAELIPPDLDHRRLPRVAGLLIGGNAGTVSYTERDWEQLLAFVEESRMRLGIAWIVSNSRRTPAAVSDRLVALAARANGPVQRFIDVRSSGPGTLQALFAESGAIVVTADSSAMVSEAIWMRRPVVAVKPARMVLPAKEAEYRRWLERDGWCREVPLSELNAERFASLMRVIVPMAENPQQELAALLASRLPELFAPVAAPC